MISEEKTMMKLLRDYYICRLYVKTSISSRSISSLTGISTGVVKRALHLLEERKEECLRLLPKAFEKAVSDGVLTDVDYIDEEHLNLLQAEVEMTSINLQLKNKWASSSVESGSTLIRIVTNINNRYFSQKRDVSLTKNQVKNLIDSGNSFQQVADGLGISKTTAYNYYKSGVSNSDEKGYQQETITRRR